VDNSPSCGMAGFTMVIPYGIRLCGTFRRIIPRTRTQKGVERVLKERGLWPAGGLNIECSKQRCPDCQAVADCKICIKGRRCDNCKKPKLHSNTGCTSGRNCDACVERKRLCTCVPKTYCPRCSDRKTGKCQECEKIPSALLTVAVRGDSFPFNPIL